MLVKLRERSTSLHKSIHNSQLTKHFTLGSDATSPLKHLYLIDKSISYTEQQKILKKIVDYCISEGVAITTAAYLSDREYKIPTPSIRLLTSIKTTDEEIDSLINTLLQAVNVSIIQKV
uniref:Serine palmitoyltransferase 1 n=1 Tax=Schizaphis graminum TaxID=13262 RepID=A0A2S2PPT9_SCHGA